MPKWECVNEKLMVEGTEIQLPLPVVQVVESSGLLVVLTDYGGGKNPVNNANLYGVAASGEMVWRIKPRLHPGGGDNPVTLLRVEGIQVIINFWEGIHAVLDASTGEYEFPESQGRPW